MRHNSSFCKLVNLSKFEKDIEFVLERNLKPFITTSIQ